jgi:hypothetical protein
MIKVAGGRAKSVTDITVRLAFGKLAKKHSDQMVPAAKSFLMFVGIVLLYDSVEGVAI